MYYVFPSLKTKVAEIRAAVERAPVSASASLTDKNGEASFSFTKEKSGVVVNADKLCCLLFIALKNGSDSIAVPLDEKEAEVRLSELMQDTHERGSFSTVFAGGEARRHNIALAAKSVCGVSVAPGEVFSLTVPWEEERRKEAIKTRPSFTKANIPKVSAGEFVRCPPLFITPCCSVIFRSEKGTAIPSGADMWSPASTPWSLTPAPI